MPTTTIRVVSFLAMVLACAGLTVLSTRIVNLSALPGWAMPTLCAAMIAWTLFGRPWQTDPQRYFVLAIWAVIFVLSVLTSVR